MFLFGKITDARRTRSPRSWDCGFIAFSRELVYLQRLQRHTYRGEKTGVPQSWHELASRTEVSHAEVVLRKREFS